MEKVISVHEAMKICDDDKEFFKELVGLMREDLKECLDILPQALSNNDSKQMREVAHRIKGQAANMAANDLCKKSKTVEDSSKLGFCTKNEYLQLVLSIKEFLRCTRDK